MMKYHYAMCDVDPNRDKFSWRKFFSLFISYTYTIE